MIIGIRSHNHSMCVIIPFNDNRRAENWKNTIPSHVIEHFAHDLHHFDTNCENGKLTLLFFFLFLFCFHFTFFAKFVSMHAIYYVLFCCVEFFFHENKIVIFMDVIIGLPIPQKGEKKTLLF